MRAADPQLGIQREPPSARIMLLKIHLFFCMLRRMYKSEYKRHFKKLRALTGDMLITALTDKLDYKRYRCNDSDTVFNSGPLT